TLSCKVVLFLQGVIVLRPLKEKVSITLDGDVVDEIKKLADDASRPFSQYINLVLRNHLKAITKRREQDNSEQE
ncbi:MAG: hypothetical protein RRY54_02645, partial [Angelakisella sp.]